MSLSIEIFIQFYANSTSLYSSCVYDLVEFMKLDINADIETKIDGHKKMKQKPKVNENGL